MLALLDRPEEAWVQLEHVDRDWSSWVGCDRYVARALLAAQGGNQSSAVADGRQALEEMNRMPTFDRIRPAAVVAPLLCDAGEPAVARDALDGVLKALGPGESGARTRTALACVLYRIGGGAGSLRNTRCRIRRGR